MQLKTGLDTNGNPTYKTKTLSNVKATALDQDIFDVAGPWQRYRSTPWSIPLAASWCPNTARRSLTALSACSMSRCN